jgi:hypothetical protein
VVKISVQLSITPVFFKNGGGAGKYLILIKMIIFLNVTNEAAQSDSVISSGGGKNEKMEIYIL